MLQCFRRIKILKGIQFNLLVQKLWQFCWIWRFCLLVELHREGPARSLQSRLVPYHHGQKGAGITTCWRGIKWPNTKGIKVGQKLHTKGFCITRMTKWLPWTIRPPPLVYPSPGSMELFHMIIFNLFWISLSLTVLLFRLVDRLGEAGAVIKRHFYLRII